MRLSQEEVLVVDSLGNATIVESPVDGAGKKEVITDKDEGDKKTASSSTEVSTTAATTKKVSVVSMKNLFKYSTPHERVLISLAIFFSVASGAFTPSVILIMGNILGNTIWLNDNKKNEVLRKLHMFLHDNRCLQWWWR